MLSKPGWNQMARFPFKIYSKVVLLNETEFIAVPRPSDSDKLFKYSINDNKWGEWIVYPEELIAATRYSAIAINKQRNILYICSNSLLVKLNLETNKWTIISHTITFGSEAAAVLVNNTFHIIGGDRNCKHYMWNENKSQFDLIHSFSEYSEGYSCQEIVHLQSQNALLLMGGYDGTMGFALRDIWKFSLINNKWETAKFTLKQTSYRFACAVSPNERYIALLGDYYSQNIYILDTKTMDIMKSKYEIPQNSYYMNAVTIINDERNKKIVFGYLRMECQIFGKLFPMDIMNTIHKWYYTTDVHIIDTYSFDNFHWRMSLHDLLTVDCSKQKQ
eukprot:445964_1